VLQVLKGAIDFKSEPWPKISEAAKDCVKKLLEMDPAKRATSEQVSTYKMCGMLCLKPASKCAAGKFAVEDGPGQARNQRAGGMCGMLCVLYSQYQSGTPVRRDAFAVGVEVRQMCN
jgi:hypothetical protein